MLRRYLSLSCYFISHFITASFILNRIFGFLLPLYLEMTVSLLFGWVTEISFRMFQSEANEICDFLWAEGRFPWSLVCLACIAAHVVYAVFMISVYDGMDRACKIWTLFMIMSFAAFCPCAFSTSLKYWSLLYYCLSKFSFTTILVSLSLDYLRIHYRIIIGVGRFRILGAKV